MTKIHRDNGGSYRFTKQDFLSHKLQEIVFPKITPKVYAAHFSNKDCPAFLVERIKLDDGHKAYNILHHQMHKSQGKSYSFNQSFFEVNEDIKELSDKHIKFCEMIRATYSDSLSKYGIAFDHTTVNMAEVNGTPVAIEMHKCHRSYLFDYNRCYEYFSNEHKNDVEAAEAINILKRINELDNEV